MMWGQIDASNRNLWKFHWVSGCTIWHRILDALEDADHQATAMGVPCATAITDLMHSAEARGLGSS